MQVNNIIIQPVQNFVMGKKVDNLPIFEQTGVKNKVFYPDVHPLHSILKEWDAASTELGGYVKVVGNE